MRPDIHILSIRDCDMTLSEIIAMYPVWQAQHPDCEVFLDGDTYSVVARPRP